MGQIIKSHQIHYRFKKIEVDVANLKPPVQHIRKQLYHLLQATKTHTGDLSS